MGADPLDYVFFDLEGHRCQGRRRLPHLFGVVGCGLWHVGGGEEKARRDVASDAPLAHALAGLAPPSNPCEAIWL